MKKSLFQLFIKRFLKYLILLILLTGMIIPLIQTSKFYIRDVVLHNLTWDLQESTDMIEHDVSKAQQMMNILSAEEAFQKLIKSSGEIPLEQYVYLTQLQTKLAQLSVIFELDTMSYLVFRNSPIFISNDGCSDNYTELMPIPLDYEDHGAEGWHNFLFESPYSCRFLPNMEFITPDFSQSGSGIIFIIDSIQSGIINDNCKLVALINCARTVDRVLNADQGEDNFIYVTDDSNQILYQYNYAGGEALSDAQTAGEAEINGRHYQIFQASSKLWGLKMVCGMSDSVIEQRVQKTMIGWLSLYIGIGLCAIIIISLVFSIRETQSMRCLINTATRSADAEYTRDEFTFLNRAFEKLGQSNLEKQEQIDLMSRQIEADILESLIMRGCYAVKEQPDYRKYFSGHFRFFCVTIFSFRTAGQSLTPMEQQQLYMLAEEVLSREALQPDYYHCFLVISPAELIGVISLNPDDSVSLNRLRNRLLQAMKMLNDQLEQEEWGVTICAGISRPAYDITNIRTAYLQAKNALSLEDQIHSGELYLYAAPQTAALKSTFESVKYQYCYDLLIRGDKAGIAAFFDDLDSSLRRRPCSDQEIMQLFFSLREPVYNAYIQILSSENAETQNLMAFPEYLPGYTAEQIRKDYSSLCLFLCDMVEKNRKNYNDANSRKILSYIQEHFSDPDLTAVRITEEFLVSEKYLYAVVKEASGKTFGKYIEGLRMGKAESLLLTTELTNIQIYQQCGFGSENTFYRNFLKSHGMPPAVWKAKMQEKSGKNA